MRAFDRHLCSPLREPLPGTGGRAPGSPGTRRAAWAAARRSRWRPCARPGRGRRTRRTAPSRCRPGTRPPATSPARLDAIVTQGRCLPRTATSGAALATKPTRQGPACAARLVVLVKAAGLHARLRAHRVADAQHAAALRCARRAPSARAARPAAVAGPEHAAAALQDPFPARLAQRRSTAEQRSTPQGGASKAPYGDSVAGPTAARSLASLLGRRQRGRQVSGRRRRRTWPSSTTVRSSGRSDSVLKVPAGARA